ncbi:unnamed protein product [Strongylus vulgaris]|uniref:Uncharacterized protein n=1 Tax=Strongylus vulgaris TaxID=40348 RepID=A0A3P7HXB2_STRVU|nr:unnamed protein product [Strongylus vulgaris]
MAERGSGWLRAIRGKSAQLKIHCLSSARLILPEGKLEAMHLTPQLVTNHDRSCL